MRPRGRTPAAAAATSGTALWHSGGRQRGELLIPCRSCSLLLASHSGRAERCGGGAFDGCGRLSPRLFGAQQRILWARQGAERDVLCRRRVH